MRDVQLRELMWSRQVPFDIREAVEKLQHDRLRIEIAAQNVVDAASHAPAGMFDGGHATWVSWLGQTLKELRDVLAKERETR